MEINIIRTNFLLKIRERVKNNFVGCSFGELQTFYSEIYDLVFMRTQHYTNWHLQHIYDQTLSFIPENINFGVTIATIKKIDHIFACPIKYTKIEKNVTILNESYYKFLRFSYTYKFLQFLQFLQLKNSTILLAELLDSIGKIMIELVEFDYSKHLESKKLAI